MKKREQKKWMMAALDREGLPVKSFGYWANVLFGKQEDILDDVTHLIETQPRNEHFIHPSTYVFGIWGWSRSRSPVDDLVSARDVSEYATNNRPSFYVYMNGSVERFS